MLVTRNEKLNGIEVKFDGVPSVETRQKLKDNHFRWNRKKGVWWVKYTDEKFAFANALSDDSKPAEEVYKTQEVKNDYGVVVGDIFHSTWGYSMTLHSFYKVVKVTKKCVYVIEVVPSKVGWSGYEGSWTLKDDEDWIGLRDENEEPKRYMVKLNTWNKTNKPYIDISSYETADLMRGDDFKREFYENHMD